MKQIFGQFLTQRKAVTFEGVKVYHETESAVLVELKDQSIWLSKKNITLIRQNGSASIIIPLRLLKKIFPSRKYKQFSDI
jgi:hypothetical protein